MRASIHVPETSLPAGTHFGEVGAVRKFGGLIVAESSYAANFATPVHTHETASFTMVLRGGYVEEYRAGTFDCLPGIVLFRTPNEPHRDRICATGADCLMLELSNPALQHIEAGGLRLSTPRQMRDALGIAARLLRELAFADPATPLAIEALALELFCEFARQGSDKRRVPRWLAAVRNRLEAEFLSSLSLQGVSEDVGRHPAHVARAFRLHFGCTVGEYVRRRRIAFACDEITAGRPLSAVAYSAGFANQAHLARTFKAVTGLTPRDFRDSETGRKARARMLLQ